MEMFIVKLRRLILSHVELFSSNSGVASRAKRNIACWVWTNLQYTCEAHLTPLGVPKGMKVKWVCLLLYIIIFIVELHMWDKGLLFFLNNTFQQHQIYHELYIRETTNEVRIGSECTCLYWSLEGPHYYEDPHGQLFWSNCEVYYKQRKHIMLSCGPPPYDTHVKPNSLYSVSPNGWE